MPLMAQINRQWLRAIDRKLQLLGLTEAMWLPLPHFTWASQPMRQRDLAASFSLDSSSVVRLLDGLESGKFVDRAEGVDKRAKTIHLTPLGKTTVKRVEELVREGRNGVLAGVPERELEDAFLVLERVAQSLDSIELESLR